MGIPTATLLGLIHSLRVTCPTPGTLVVVVVVAAQRQRVGPSPDTSRVPLGGLLLS